MFQPLRELSSLVYSVYCIRFIALCRKELKDPLNVIKVLTFQNSLRYYYDLFRFEFHSKICRSIGLL